MTTDGIYYYYYYYNRTVCRHIRTCIIVHRELTAYNIIVVTLLAVVMQRTTAVVLDVIILTSALSRWPAVAVAWDTGRMYGTPMRARLTDVAVWRNRAYACWPRTDASQPVTLLELPWPETDNEQSLSWKPRRPFYADQQVSVSTLRYSIIKCDNKISSLCPLLLTYNNIARFRVRSVVYIIKSPKGSRDATA